MPDIHFYPDPLLSNLAQDYSTHIRRSLVGSKLFPRIVVSSPTGRIAKHKADDFYLVPDARIERAKGEAATASQAAEKQDYACQAYSLKDSVGKADLQIHESGGMFSRATKNTVNRLTVKLEMAAEQRIATLLNGLSGSSVSTVPAAEKWSVDGSDPIEYLKAQINEMPIHPNLLVLANPLFTALEKQRNVIGKLPVTSYQSVTKEALQQLLRVERVIVAEGRKKSTKTGPIDFIWGNIAILAYTGTTDDPDEPCAGRSLAVEYPETEGTQYLVREWDDPKLGIAGGKWYQVAHDVDEVVVSPDLIRVIKNAV